MSLKIKFVFMAVFLVAFAPEYVRSRLVFTDLSNKFLSMLNLNNSAVFCEIMVYKDHRNLKEISDEFNEKHIEYFKKVSSAIEGYRKRTGLIKESITNSVEKVVTVSKNIRILYELTKDDGSEMVNNSQVKADTGKAYFASCWLPKKNTFKRLEFVGYCPVDTQKTYVLFKGPFTSIEEKSKGRIGKHFDIDKYYYMRSMAFSNENSISFEPSTCTLTIEYLSLIRTIAIGLLLFTLIV